MKKDIYELWEALSINERTEILKEGEFWEGFGLYIWDYIPEEVKAFIKQKLVH